MEKNMKIIAAIVVVVIVIAAAAFAIAKNGDKKDGGDSTDTDTDTYYFFLDGMNANNGWHSAEGADAVSAFESAMKADGVKCSVKDGWVTFEGYEGSYDSETGTGTGIGVWFYGSTDVENYYSGYFFNGPAMDDVASNILYFAYSYYAFDEDYNTTYALNPTTTNAAVSAGGPFTDKDYEPLSYDTYYFFLDGMGDNNGWHSADGADAVSAFESAMKADGVKCSVKDGWVTFEGYEGSYDSETGTGTGIGVWFYGSTDVENYYSGYFFNGPAMDDVASNILYFAYSYYAFDEDYNTTYALNPTTTNAAVSAGGPFE